MTLQKDSCFHSRVIQHELMHVLGYLSFLFNSTSFWFKWNLGFDHEHQRIDRDQYINVYLDNMLDEFVRILQKNSIRRISMIFKKKVVEQMNKKDAFCWIQYSYLFQKRFSKLGINCEMINIFHFRNLLWIRYRVTKQLIWKLHMIIIRSCTMIHRLFLKMVNQQWSLNNRELILVFIHVSLQLISMKLDNSMDVNNTILSSSFIFYVHSSFIKNKIWSWSTPIVTTAITSKTILKRSSIVYLFWLDIFLLYPVPVYYFIKKRV